MSTILRRDRYIRTTLYILAVFLVVLIIVIVRTGQWGKFYAGQQGQMRGGNMDGRWQLSKVDGIYAYMSDSLMIENSTIGTSDGCNYVEYGIATSGSHIKVTTVSSTLAVCVVRFPLSSIQLLFPNQITITSEIVGHDFDYDVQGNTLRVTDHSTTLEFVKQ